MDKFTHLAEQMFLNIVYQFQRFKQYKQQQSNLFKSNMADFLHFRVQSHFRPTNGLFCKLKSMFSVRI
jgi:hypothetical protein